ncbi:hypothetical protein BLNAU_9887 [Blattamonas nauphoetae]|uniref:Uncharacterized protein n=1 Tax=Blattamonas nauphoetae TaxID=2049346 RepID=A0ABQ9XUJ7_9EUKA|nr:hypothetical protein BLNAU_9887 [Blattamonas nauphoetae]
MMLKYLLVLVTESDWALSTILSLEYIKPLEEYCEQTQPCDVPIALPKLMSFIGKSSEGELVHICKSSIPSIFLRWVVLIKNDNVLTELGNCLLLLTSTNRSSSTFLTHHKTQFLAFLDHVENSESSLPQVTILAQLYFSPHLKVSKIALQTLSSQSDSDSETCSFLQTLKVHSASNESSSELVPFAARLCSTLPSESPLLSGKTALEVLCERTNLLKMCALVSSHLVQILIDCDFVPLLKSTIITCLDLLDQEESGSICPPESRTDLLITILDSSWSCVAHCVGHSLESLLPVAESAFSDVPQLCSLLERTSCHSTPTNTSHLAMIINIGANLLQIVPRMLEEALIQRVIDTSKPMAVQTTQGGFHLGFIWAINNLVGDPRDITEDEEEQKRIRMLQFERALKPAKQYLQFILQREEFIPQDDSSNQDISAFISELLERTKLLERDLFEDGEIVETGREEWEVGWLVEMTDEEVLAQRLEVIYRDDEMMRRNEKERWKKRVERQREAGHEDALEGWLLRRDEETRSEIEEFVESESAENGMNNTMWEWN